MTVVTVDDLHLAADPDAHLARSAKLAHVRAGSKASRLIVRVPDHESTGVRALGAEDVVRLLRRHGRIREIAVTDGGTIVAAADVCRRRGEVAVWTGQAIGRWHPSDVTLRGLGGSETAAVRLAEELSRMGYVTTLYGDFEQPGLADDVQLRHFQTFDPTEPLEALIVFRDARGLDPQAWGRPNARFVGLWLEDLAPAEALTPARAANLDRVIAVSCFHRGQVLGVHPWLDESLVVAGRNGIKNEWFDEQPAPKRNTRVVYSSSPDRGADIVLELWPEILARVPDAELVLTYSRWFEQVAPHFPAAQQHLDLVRKLVKQPGVNRIEGGIGQKALANLLRSSLVWVHPSFYTPGNAKFDETNCISCQEAQAAGCVVVASNWGALSEFVMHGTLIDGNPSEKDGVWRREFVESVVRGLTDNETQEAAQMLGPEYMKHMGWSGAAEQLVSLFGVAR